jgi:hypothetical protein
MESCSMRQRKAIETQDLGVRIELLEQQQRAQGLWLLIAARKMNECRGVASHAAS